MATQEQMPDCRERVLDLFVTKDSSNYANQFDDTFVGPVWSVDIAADQTTAYVVIRRHSGSHGA